MATNTESLRIQLELEVGDLQSKLRKAETELKKLGGSTTSLAKGTNQANTALVNFGRVVQDAPFGLIGIANNIDPLIASFQNLKATTGTAGAAFRQLGSALLGPAGIAIAVSAVTSAFIAFGPEIKALIFDISKFEQALNDAGAAGVKAFRETQIDVSRFVQTLQDINATALQQKQALSSLNDILGKYGLEVKNVSDAQRVGAEVGRIYALIKQQEAKANALAAVSAEEYVKTLKAQRNIQQGVSLTTGSFINQLKFFLNPNLTSSVLTFGNAIKNVNEAADFQGSIDKEIEAINNQIGQLTFQLEGLDGVTQKTTKNQKKAFKSVADEVKFLKSDVTELTQLPNTDFAVLFNLEKARRAFKEVKDNVSGIIDLGRQLTAPLDLAKGLEPSIKPIQTIKTNLDAIQSTAELLPQVFDAAFTSIAQGQSAFQALGNAVKALITRLAAAAAAAAVLSILTGGAGGAGVNIAGQALKGFKQIFSVLSGLSFRESGGSVRGNQPFIVGERGPELFVPNTSGAIVNSNNLALSGAQSLVARVSGNDLLFLLNRAQRQQGRLG